MPSILLVDDSAFARRAIAGRLRSEGYDVVEAGTSAEALAADLAAIDCAVLDVELDELDGPALAAALLARRAGLPVAFFTAGASAPVVARAQAFGPVMAKPDLEPLVAWAHHVAP